MSREGFAVRFVAGICTEFSVSVDFIRRAGMTQRMTKTIYGISAIDPVTFVGVAIARTSIALAACYIQARRGMHVDSMVALRYEQRMPDRCRLRAPSHTGEFTPR
jgi:hypothetical protein